MRNNLPFQEGQVIQITHGTVQIIGDDIFYVKFDRDTLLEKEDFSEAFHLYAEATADGPMKILAEFLEFTSATRDARNYAEDLMVDALAGAIIFNGLAQRILVQAYQLLNKQQHPVRSFTAKQKAIEWLNSI